jgi:TetR/AcrR family acrAB operon transcriptional repressor
MEAGGWDVARRTKEEAQETRGRILESALDIFCEKNFSNVSMTEIAESIGLTKGAVYWHFKSKNDILLQLIEEMCRQTERDFIDIYGIPESLEGLRLYYKSAIAHLSQDERYLKIHKLMFRRHEWPDDVQKRVSELVKKSIEREQKMLEMLIAKEQSEGKIRKDVPPTVASTVIGTVFRGICLLQLSELLDEDFADHIDFLLDAFLGELKKGF